jgi:outer membrane biogenesis lipoprotein LolB
MNKTLLFLFFCLHLILASCSKDSDVKPNKNKINHEGEKWKISSAEYSIIDQNLTNTSQGIKTGTVSDAGAFYFNGGKGSFSISIDSYLEEDVFSLSENNTDVSITSISQNLGNLISQNIISFSGEKDTDLSMILNGSITRQSLTGQFILSGKFILTKE